MSGNKKDAEKNLNVFLTFQLGGQYHIVGVVMFVKRYVKALVNIISK